MYLVNMVPKVMLLIVLLVPGALAMPAQLTVNTDHELYDGGTGCWYHPPEPGIDWTSWGCGIDPSPFVDGSGSHGVMIWFDTTPEEFEGGASVSTRGSALGSGFAAVAFNPQPEPPGDWFHVSAQTRGSPVGNPGCEVGFNPQPEPPGSWCTP